MQWPLKTNRRLLLLCTLGLSLLTFASFLLESSSLAPDAARPSQSLPLRPHAPTAAEEAAISANFRGKRRFYRNGFMRFIHWSACYVNTWPGPWTEIELNHYVHRGLAQAIDKRVRKGDKREVDVRMLDMWDSRCLLPARQQRFLPLQKELDAMNWSERLARYHRGNSTDGLFCVPAFFSNGSTACRRHFLTSYFVIDEVEVDWAQDFIDFHTVAGVDHFMAFDSRPNATREAWMEPYIRNGVLEHVPCIIFDASVIYNSTAERYEPVSPTGVSGWGGCAPAGAQKSIRASIRTFVAVERIWRREAVRRMAESMSSFWVANHDVDEFFMPLRGTSLRRTLMPLTRQGHQVVHGIFVFAYELGSSGWDQKPAGVKVLEAFRYGDGPRTGNGKSLALLDAIDPQTYTGYPHKISLRKGQRYCSLLVVLAGYHICLEDFAGGDVWAAFTYGLVAAFTAGISCALCTLCLCIRCLWPRGVEGRDLPHGERCLGCLLP